MESKYNLIERIQGGLNNLKAEIENEINKYVQKKFPFEKILEEVIIPMYNKNFSNKELKEIIVFYSSPAGKKFYEILPSLAEENEARVMEFFITPLENESRKIYFNKLMKLESSIE